MLSFVLYCTFHGVGIFKRLPNAQRPTPNAQRPTPNAQRPTPNAQRNTTPNHV